MFPKSNKNDHTGADGRRVPRVASEVLMAVCIITEVHLTHSGRWLCSRESMNEVKDIKT